MTLVLDPADVDEVWENDPEYDPLAVFFRALMPMPWTERAACRGAGPSLFFAAPGERPEERARREARAAAYCGACPVESACRGHAHRERESGFWAGESDEARAAAGLHSIGSSAKAKRLAAAARRAS